MRVNEALKFLEVFSVLNYRFKQPNSYVYFCKVVVATGALKYATWNLMTFLYGSDPGEKLFNIRNGITNNAIYFSTMDSDCPNL